MRNPHVDLVFGDLTVELEVRQSSDGAADEENVALAPAARLGFGEVQFAQGWQTRALWRQVRERMQQMQQMEAGGPAARPPDAGRRDGEVIEGDFIRETKP